MSQEDIQQKPETYLLYPPVALVVGSLSGFYWASWPGWMNLVMLALFPIAWFLTKHPLPSLMVVTLLSGLLANRLCNDFLQKNLARQPSEQATNKTYHIRGRFLTAREGEYGYSLRLDRLEILSPQESDFQLDQLTVYVPKLANLPRHKSNITAWINLKRRADTHPFPRPLQALREQYMPSLYGTVKSDRLLAYDPQEFPTLNLGMSQGNRELCALILQGTPSPIWRERLHPFGLGHLLAISGLHCIFVFLALQLMLFPIRHPLVRVLATTLGLLLFADRVGWTTSVTRASLMLIGWQVLPVFGRDRSWLRLWFGMMVIAIVSDPLVLLQRGFWYSFAASLGIMLGARGGGQHGKPLPTEHPLLTRVRPLLPIFAAQLIVMPINLMFEGQTQFTNLFWNCLGFFFLLLLGILLLCALTASQLPILIPLANRFEDSFARVLDVMHLPADTMVLLRFPQQPAWVLLCVLILALLLIYGGKEWRWYFAMASFYLFCLLGRPLSGERLIMLDVGQGLCILHVDAEGVGTLFDAGGRLPGRFRIDQLAKLHGAQYIRGAYISHLNADHYNLLEKVPRRFPLWVPPGQHEAFINNELLAGFQIKSVSAGEREQWGSITATLHWPPKKKLVFPNSNEESLVMALQGDGWWMLLTGDAGTWMESRLDLPKRHGTAVLQVGHHGSKTATGQSLLNRLKPGAALISCGYRNRFSHPHPQVMTRLEQQNVSVFNTARSGSISIMVEGKLTLTH